MATIQKLINKKGVSYRVLIRNKGLKAISKTFPSKKLANQFVMQVESDWKIQLSLGGKSNTKSFKDISKEYRIDRYGGISSTPVPYESRIRYWDDLFDNKKIIDITKNDISDGLKSLPNRLSNASINKFRGAVSAVLSYACREYNLPYNPARYTQPMAEPRGRVRFLSSKEKGDLFKVCKSSSWNKLYLLVLMAVTTGARKGELINLKFTDIDFNRNIAYVSTTKNGEPKVLPLTDEVVLELCRFRNQNAHHIFNSEIKTDRPMCFTKLWRRALEQANIQDFRFHDLRHTTASYLAQNGASLLEIAEVLGHKQISVTKRYAHLCIDHKAKLVNRVLGDIAKP
ncbi:MAG: site-specific integrase [Epsilonproteobacteria bacterium]|nr:site-specific integrase [Campylobacterota bacterium]